MLKPKEEPILYQFLQDMSGTIMDICLENSKLLEEDKDGFSKEELLQAYNSACLGFIFDVGTKREEEAEWFSQLITSIANRYDDGLRDVRAYKGTEKI